MLVSLQLIYVSDDVNQHHKNKRQYFQSNTHMEGPYIVEIYKEKK